MLKTDNTKKKMGIGVDIETVKRFRRLSPTRNRRFLARIYSRSEQVYCFSQKTAAQSLAARFAGKEAIVKALSACLGRAVGLAYVDIEIRRTKSGWPQVLIKDRNYQDFKVYVSLSHTSDFALAAAVARKL